MRGNEKGMAALQEALRQLVANTVRFFWRDLSRLKGLPQLIGNHGVSMAAPCDVPVAGIQEGEGMRGGFPFAAKGGDKLAVLRFVGVLCVGCALYHALQQGFPLADVHRDDSCSCHNLLQNEKNARHIPAGHE